MLEQLTVAAALEKLANREISARELTEAVLTRIDDVDKSVRAYITVTGERALQAAEKIDEKRAKGENTGPLAGVPVALKDNICTGGVLTSCASKMLANYIPPYDATVALLLQEAGAILVGKTNLDEFAMGSSTESSAFFTSRNPWDLTRVPGGSSGGSAAAVAADETLFSLGTDTGGSIRQPAAFCGIVGLKPTYGRVSRFGVVALASSLDHVGPLTKDVRDCALIMNVIAGHDKNDSTSAELAAPDYTSFLDREIKGLKIGVPVEYFNADIEDGVKKAVRKAIDVFVSLGAEVEEISLPHTEYALPAFYILAAAEASSNLARYDGVQYGLHMAAANLDDFYKKNRSEGFGSEVKRRIIFGTYILSSGNYDHYYLKAMKVRTLVKEDFERAFAGYDLILTPAAPTTAFKAGAVEDRLQMYFNDSCTVAANLAGLPAISLPCGFADGLPVGLQLIGKPFAEGTVLQAAYAYEQNSGLPKSKPAVKEAGGALHE